MVGEERYSVPDHLCHRVLRALHTLMDLTQREIAKFPSVQASGVYSALTFAHWPFSVWPSVYWCTAALKSLDVWWHEESAVYYALSMDQIVTPFGLWLLGFPDLLALLSRATIALEFLGRCLILVPFFTPWLRIFVVGAFFCFHIGLALCMSIGLFPYVSMVSWLVFVPSLVWERGYLPSLHSLRPARFSQALAAFFLVYILLWNLRGLEATSPYVRQIFPPYANLVGYLLRLDQYWNMFSPKPLDITGWIILSAVKLNGADKIDLWRQGQPLSMEKPYRYDMSFSCFRIRKMMENLVLEHKNYSRYYLTYLCDKWNKKTDEQLIKNIRFIYMKQIVPPIGEELPEPEQILIRRKTCKKPQSG